MFHVERVGKLELLTEPSKESVSVVYTYRQAGDKLKGGKKQWFCYFVGGLIDFYLAWFGFTWTEVLLRINLKL